MPSNNQDIFRTQVRQGVALAWVNSYSAVVVKPPGATLLFDPVSMAVPLGVSLDLIAVSHSHSDHWDPQLVTALRESTGAVVAASPSLISRLDGVFAVKKEGLDLECGEGDDEIPPEPPLQRGGAASFSQREDTAPRQLRGDGTSTTVAPVQPGDDLKIGDVTVTALRCDHPAVEPVSFLVRSDEGVTLYLPGDTTPFPEMAQLGQSSQDLSSTEMDGSQQLTGVDILIWMGTAFEDGARISELVQPKVMVTYAVDPPAAGARAKDILTRYTPEVPCHSLSRHQVFVYP